MPIYDYDCAACGRRFEVIHGVHAEGPTTCPLCGGGPVRKAITAPAVHYRGSGWAKKERRTAVATGASKSGDDAAGEGGSGADGGDKPDRGTKQDTVSKPAASSGDGDGKSKAGRGGGGSTSKGD